MYCLIYKPFNIKTDPTRETNVANICVLDSFIKLNLFAESLDMIKLTMKKIKEVDLNKHMLFLK